MTQSAKDLEILTLQLGPMENNTYLLADAATGEAVVIDPSFDSQLVQDEAAQRGWRLQAVWLTHAHFDHIAGVKLIAEAANPPLPVGLHPADLPIWREGGGARLFGLKIDPGPKPSILFTADQKLQVGQHIIQVRHTPGHTPGHVVFYAPEASAVICGDLIFYRGVGRTDLPGGDPEQLIHSIHTHIMSLPPETRLLSGHGPETTVGEEAAENPYL
ncbi:MAG TPA: MBL fold metallo-hydrolase [Anaerolineaceae bacterium]